MSEGASQNEPGDLVSVNEVLVDSPRSALLAKPTIACAIAGIALALLQFAPGLEGNYRPVASREPLVAKAATPGNPLTVQPDTIGQATLADESESRPELEQPEHAEAPKSARGPIADRHDDPIAIPDVAAITPPISIEDRNGSALRGFYEALNRARHRRGESIARIAHFGDSIVVSDLVSGTLRRKFQDEFGDAGHGFVLLAGAWPAYHHNDVYRWASPGWRVSRIVGPIAADGLYGLGGVSFSAPAGARARFGTAKKGHYGRVVSRFELSYLAQPGECRFELLVDGKHHSDLVAIGSKKRLQKYSIDVPTGEHLLEVVTRSGSCRAFGVVLEAGNSGVVLDALGIQGARIRFLDKQDDDHWADALQQRHPDLLIFQFGANESADGFAYSMKDYHRTMKEVLVQSRQALPEAGCLIVGAMDRARKEDNVLVSLPIMPHLVREQRAVALEVGCAFFDTREAMGGAGSMPRWVRQGLGQADFTHPTGYGAEVLGNWLYRALIQGYNAHLARERTPELQ